MPRGYLKHNKEICKKRARGGSSGQRCIAKTDPDPPRICRAFEDFAVDAQSVAKKNTVQKAKAAYPTGECIICFEERPIVCLSNKCRWHDAAYQQCLHRTYVTDAQKSTKNYPLACFHPPCDQPVQTSQMEKHNLFASPAEAKKHYGMIVLSKIEKTEGMRTVHCPECDTPRGIRKLGDKKHTYGCNNCKTMYQVSPFYATLRALENMKCDDIGINDGWANCPKYSILISKGDGCEHIWCTYCDHEFDWDTAQEKKKRVRHARVPDNEIYLWW